MLTHFKAPSDVVDGHVAFAVLVDDLETFDVQLYLFFAEVDGDLVSARPVDHLAHLVVEEFRCQLVLPLLLS